MRTALVLIALCLPLALEAQDFDAFRDHGHRDYELFTRHETGKIQRGGELEGRPGHELGDVSVGGSVGLAFDEIGFLATGEADFWFTRFFSAGPLLQLNTGRDFFLIAGGGPKITFDFDDNDFSDLVKPYVHLGPAFVIASGDHDHHRHHRHHDPDTEVGFAIVLGTGVDFYITDNLSLGTGFLWNWLVTRPLDDRFYFGWKVIEAKFHF
ncbi:MAG: hypothetical protein KDB29_01850 [Planctomycetes bacterium]|nr:hypothetical protein [Planctomycetota bacterium]